MAIRSCSDERTIDSINQFSRKESGLSNLISKINIEKSKSRKILLKNGFSPSNFEKNLKNLT